MAAMPDRTKIQRVRVEELEEGDVLPLGIFTYIFKSRSELKTRPHNPPYYDLTLECQDFDAPGNGREIMCDAGKILDVIV